MNDTPFKQNNLQRLVRHLMEHGHPKGDRTGVGTLSQFGMIERYDLEAGHPHENAKYTPFKINVAELLWIISGSTQLAFLKQWGCHVWDEWVKPGTEVWGKTYDFKERQAMLAQQIESGRILESDKDNWVDQWMAVNKDMVMQQDDVELMMDQFRIPRRELLDGQLGPVYGQQWRNIIDTRIIEHEEEQDYLERGYTFMGTMLTPEDLSSGKCNGSKVIVQRKIDQLANVIEQLKTRPDDRGIIVNAWHVPDLDQMALRPCHTLFQFETIMRPWSEVFSEIMQEDHYDEFNHLTADMSSDKQVGDDWVEAQKPGGGWRHPDYYAMGYEFAQQKGLATRKLNCLLYMRSNDTFLGRPFNISQYALLTRMVAQVVNMNPGEFILVNGDVHLYNNHHDAAKKLLEQDGGRPLPWVNINPEVKNIDDFKVADFELINYTHGPKIGAPVAV